MEKEQLVSEKQVLGLQLPTDPRWVNIAEISIEEILADHAWCEQKAANTCISLIVKFSEKEELVQQVAPIVAEEWGHFRKVLKELTKRGYKLGKARPDEYVKKLLHFENRQLQKDERVVEKLLISALIEARSCERFRLLSLHMKDEYFKNFYHEFMVSEAGHYKLFLSLAKLYMPEDYVNKRWKEYLEAEVEILKSIELRGDRIH
ncbi:MAG: tRNA-(ms[2]io[6]A)-hydroxylase [Bacteroidia bacterium]|nr:tRNA-(ms[2]io[6]A)-hydroxylase [Bacteroidia bacterium]